MPIKSILYIVGLLTCSSGAVLVTPMIGIGAYLLAYNINPLHFWWASYIPGALHRYAFILATASFIGVIFNARKLKFRRFFERQEILLIIYVLLIWLSTSIGLQNMSSHENTVKMTKVALILLLSSHIITEYKYYNIIVWILIASGLYSGYEVYSSDYLSFYHGRLETGIGGSDFSEGNFFAAHYLIILPWVGIRFLSGSWKAKFVCLLAAAFIINTLILVESRGSFLALATGAVVSILFANKIYRKKIILLLMIGIVGFLFLSDKSFWDRMGTIQTAQSQYRGNEVMGSSGIDKSAGGRLEAWAAALKMFIDHPLGIGEGNFTLIVGNYNPLIAGKDTHNTFLRCLAELGVQGLIVLLFMIYTSFSMLRSISKQLDTTNPLHKALKLEILALRVSLVMYLVATNFLTHTYIEEFYWLLMFPVFLKRSFENMESKETDDI